jgi:hypothetical protein
MMASGQPESTGHYCTYSAELEASQYIWSAPRVTRNDSAVGLVISITSSILRLGDPQRE